MCPWIIPSSLKTDRVAHQIAIKDRQEPVTTEELRQAMIHYRALFADLLHDGGMMPIREVRNDTRNLAREAGR